MRLGSDVAGLRGRLGCLNVTRGRRRRPPPAPGPVPVAGPRPPSDPPSPVVVLPVYVETRRTKLPASLGRGEPDAAMQTDMIGVLLEFCFWGRRALSLQAAFSSPAIPPTCALGGSPPTHHLQAPEPCRSSTPSPTPCVSARYLPTRPSPVFWKGSCVPRRNAGWRPGAQAKYLRRRPDPPDFVHRTLRGRPAAWASGRAGVV